MEPKFKDGDEVKLKEAYKFCLNDPDIRLWIKGLRWNSDNMEDLGWYSIQTSEGKSTSFFEFQLEKVDAS